MEYTEDEMKRLVSEFQEKVKMLFNEYNAKLDNDLDFMNFVHSNKHNLNNMMGFGCMGCMKDRLNRRTGIKHNTDISDIERVH